MSLAQLESLLGNWSTLNTWQKGNLTIAATTLTSATTDKGFTGHRQLDSVGLIHMGGRVYDAEIGRFLSADPFVADSTNLQGLNRYSYVENNPLSYTDPSGYFLKGLIKKWGKALKSAVSAVIEFERELRRKILRSLGKIEGLSTVISIGMTILIPGCQTGVCAMIFNAAMADANGGTIGQVLSGAAIGWVTGGITQGLTDLLGGTWQAQLGAMMFMGGITAKAQGGKFADGVKGGAISFGLVRIMSAVGEPARMTGEDTAAAKAAGDVYGSDGGLLKELGINYEPRDGFAAALTLDESIGQHILAFRGTSPTSFSDWMANIGQGLIGSSSQYDQARVLARAVHAKLGGNVIFAGHSLGGGLASAAAFATGGRAITFNAAGLHSSYRTGTPGDIRAHYIRGDILTTLQRFTPMPNAAGTPVGHSGSWYQGPMQRHMISNFR